MKIEENNIKEPFDIRNTDIGTNLVMRRRSR